MKRALLTVFIALALVYAAAYFTTPRARGGRAPDRRPAPLSPAEIAVDSALEASRSRMLDGARELERKYRDLDAFRDIRGQSTVIVGNSFIRIEYAVKSQACVAVSQARGALGLSRDYFLREPMNNRRVGYFNGASLEME